MTHGPEFMLGTFAQHGGKPFAGLVAGERVFPVRVLHGAFRSAAAEGADALATAASVQDLLEDWERNFALLQEYAARVATAGGAGFADGALPLAALAVLPPVPRPPKILNAAANYGGHVKEMRQYTVTGMAEGKDKAFAGVKAGARPYLFLKASSSLCGAFDDVVLPDGKAQVDWEAELALAIGRRGRRVAAERALDHVAGFMTFNDVSCRSTLFREDRPNFRTDWLASKSFDTFGPLGPFFVPRAFVKDHAALRIELKVNGRTMQDGRAGDMIFSPEEQIEYAARFMTLEPGDIFATGTVAGVGQGQGAFLKAGDVMEAHVHGLGAQRNRVVAAEHAAPGGPVSAHDAAEVQRGAR